MRVLFLVIVCFGGGLDNPIKIDLGLDLILFWLSLVLTIDHFFFFFNNMIKEKTLTVIPKIPTGLTGIKSLFLMENISVLFLTDGRAFIHTYAHSVMPGHPFQGILDQLFCL